jgi:uncharacterized protein YndB with AHSA1/START domain/uncharacterized glyoxalase superfamily protein PhnB
VADRNEILVEAPPGEGLLRLTRRFDAPRDLVWDCFTKPEHVARWWGPEKYAIEVEEFDVRPGGKWRVRHSDGTRTVTFFGEYREVVKPERLSRSFCFMEFQPIEEEYTFHDEGKKARLVCVQRYADAAARDRMAKSGAVEGGRESFERLDALLGALRAQSRSSAMTDPVFTLTRTFDAPLPLVWEMYSRMEHLTKWWGPKGFAWVSGGLDFREGGTFHYGMRAPDGRVMWGKFVYREIVPMRKIAFTTSFSNEAGTIERAPFAQNFPLEVLNTVEFSGTAGRTTLHMTGTPYNASDEEKAFFQSMFPSMSQGFEGTLDQLENYLSTAGKWRQPGETAMQLNAYLHFDGNCEEAFRFYEQAAGGVIEMRSTFGESPMAAQMPAMKDKIVQARMRIGDQILMGSDSPPDRFQKPQGFSLSLGCRTNAEAERVFQALSAGGQVHMPLAQSFFAERFGMLVDKFGIPWMVICEKSAA